MSRQTRIDQFYASKNSKRTQGTKNIKKDSRLISSPFINTKKEKVTFNSKQNNIYACEGMNVSDINKISKKSMKSENDQLRSSPIKQKNNKRHTLSTENNIRSPKKIKTEADTNSMHVQKTFSPKSRRSLALQEHSHTTDLIYQALRELNLAKQGAIPPNNFNLEELYNEDTFSYWYYEINTTVEDYELKDINVPDSDASSKFLFNIIIKTFSNPINCGYFDVDELDFIYSIITLPLQAQMLLARMLKRQRTWYRKGSVNYPEIAPDLENIFKILSSRSICVFATEEKEMTSFLELLQVDEIRKICRELKIDGCGKKEENIRKLQQSSKRKSLFPGLKSPKNILNSLIFKTLGYCVRITDKVWNIFDRILTLLIPNQDPQINISDTYFMLLNVYKGEIIFPIMPIERFPIFSSKEHLLSYIEAKSKLSETLNSIEKKEWQEVREFGLIAKEKLSILLQSESKFENFTLPMHVRHFLPGYVWLKVLSNTIDAFKKTPETKAQAVEMLNLLINQDCHLKNRKGQWYDELALIKMSHYKDIESSAEIVIQALKTNSLTHVDKVNLIERANRIVKRKSGIKESTKNKILHIITNYTEQIMPTFKIQSIEIEGVSNFENSSGSKRKWCIETGVNDKSYGSVETLALYYYKSQGFVHGTHCEGALPITLFTILFWNELYNIHIPGAYVTEYQSAPLDLYTDKFYTNRKEQIDNQLETINNLDLESLCIFVEDTFNKYNQYQSVMQTNVFKESSCLKEIVYCLGINGIVGICRRLIDNFKLWSAGFPDLIVWNTVTKEYKIVEVKGPGDKLSTKQRLWLDYLNQIGLTTEICLVKNK